MSRTAGGEGASAMLELIGRVAIGSPITVFFDRTAVSGKYRGLYYNAMVVENGKAVYYVLLSRIAAVELPFESRPKLTGRRTSGGARRRPARRLQAPVT